MLLASRGAPRVVNAKRRRSAADCGRTNCINRGGGVVAVGKGAGCEARERLHAMTYGRAIGRLAVTETGVVARGGTADQSGGLV